MRILLSNDDGVRAPGIAALHAAVADMGEVTVAAPCSGRSAAAHSITLHECLTVEKIRIAGPPEFDAWSVDGSPADCVRLAILELMDGPPDIVLSGINRGANVGVNVFYSGTVAAAAEGAMFHIPAVAFSAEVAPGGGEPSYPAVAAHCRTVLRALLAGKLSPGEIVNVNVPLLGGLPGGLPRGIVSVPQSRAEMKDAYRRLPDANGKRVYQLGDDYGFGPGGADDADVPSLAEGYITVTPLHVDMTDHRRLRTLRDRDWPRIA